MLEKKKYIYYSRRLYTRINSAASIDGCSLHFSIIFIIIIFFSCFIKEEKKKYTHFLSRQNIKKKIISSFSGRTKDTLRLQFTHSYTSARNPLSLHFSLSLQVRSAPSVRGARPGEEKSNFQSRELRRSSHYRPIIIIAKTAAAAGYGYYYRRYLLRLCLRRRRCFICPRKRAAVQTFSSDRPISLRFKISLIFV